MSLKSLKNIKNHLSQNAVKKNHPENSTNKIEVIKEVKSTT